MTTSINVSAFEHRDPIPAARVDAFPDEATRPARQVHDGSHSIPQGPIGSAATFQAYDGPAGVQSTPTEMRR